MQAGAEFWREKCFPRREMAVKETNRAGPGYTPPRAEQAIAGD
jgi:hypothetical protein